MIYDKAMELVAALRSGKYLQGKRYLRPDRSHYCCLGVACKISAITKFKRNEYCNYSYDGHYENFPDSVKDYFGFYDRDGGRRDGKLIIIDERGYINLTHANDSGVSFAKIADYIETIGNNYNDI